MILSICDMPETLSVLRIIQIVITIIKIVVPILLIVSAMIELVRAVTNSELNKISKPIVNKIIAAILIFLIPTFVKIIANIAGNNGEYENCLGNITVETINNAYNNREEELVKKAEETNSLTDYNNGINNLISIKDQNKKAEYQQRLNEVKKKIDEENESKRNTNNRIITDYIMFLGDSRTSAYDYYSKEMGMDLTKDKIIARSGTSYDSYFKEHLAEALQELKTSNKTYNVTVNYGVNGLQDKGNFCSDYLNFVKQMGDNNFYIVSVTPVNDSVSPYARNSKITQFNDYMLNECLPKLKEANRNVYYCDVYNKIPLKDWMKYVDSSGFHFNGSGYKFIYESIKECTQ